MICEGRVLSRSEIRELWEIDRSELIEAVYCFVDETLVLRPERCHVKGWPPGEPEKYTPILEACHDGGGWFYGLFDGQKPAGAVVLESRFIGKCKDQLQLKFLHVGRDYRDRGFGRQLFDLATSEARKRGAKSLYISATPSEHTVNFYLRLGCKVVSEPDPELLELEPEDIHLEYDLGLSEE
jgi:ribosomal protein S18 acetylase RimI-like enzyme